MRIPMSQFNAASAAAVPSQASRASAGIGTTANASTASTVDNITEKLGASNRAGDRDAQEQYLGNDAGQPTANQEKNDKDEPNAASSSLWQLEVHDDSPPSDLDIRG